MVHQVIEKSPVREELEHGAFQTIEIELGRKFKKRKVMECRIGKHALIGVISRGRRILIAKGTSDLLPGDRILVIAERSAAERVRIRFQELCFPVEEI